MHPALTVDDTPNLHARGARAAADAAEPIRLLNVVPTLMCGGTENQFMTLGRRLDASRFSLEFACLRRWGQFVDEIAARGVPLAEYRVTTFRSVNALAQQARLVRHIVRNRIQIVHAYNFYGNVFAVPPARLAGVAVIASIRDRAPYLTPMQKRVQRYACRFADCILVNAGAVRDWLADEGYDASKIVVIPNGVDLSRFDAPVDRAAVRAMFDLPPHARLVTVVSRLNRLKGLEHFLEAAAILAPMDPSLRFLIVGETNPFERDYLDELVALASRLGIRDRVVFAGLRSDIPALLGAADVAVMPSLNEALSNVVLESMAASAPIVATRVGGTPEALADGAHGLLVPPGDARALAAGVARLLADRPMAAALGRAARRAIEERFSVDRMVESTEALYLDLLARKTHTPRRGHHVGRVLLDPPEPSAAGIAGSSHVGRVLLDPPANAIARETLVVETITDHAAFLALEDEWNDAVERAGITHPFLTHEWLRTWWECFGAGRQLHIVVVRSGGRVTAIAPLLRESVWMYGAPLRQIRMMQNDHTPRIDVIVAGREEESYRAIWEALQQTRERWDVLLLSGLPAESRTRAFVAGAALAARRGTGTWQSDASPYLTLDGTWNDYLKQRLSPKFRQNLRNRLKRLTQVGEPGLEVVGDPAAIEAACADALRLEASGWKAGEGTAIGSNAAVEQFYTRLAPRAAARGWLRLLFLTVGGRRIAAAYAAQYAGRLFLCKTGYDPAYATCSPFKLLTWFALQHAFAEGLEEFDFLGDAESWKLEWTATTRPHDWLFVFAGTPRARFVHPIKCRLVPALKQWSESRQPLKAES